MKKFLLPLILTLTVSGIACFAGCTSAQSSRTRTQPDTNAQRNIVSDEAPDTDFDMPDGVEVPDDGFAPRRPMDHRGHRRMPPDGGMHRAGKLPPPPEMNGDIDELMRNIEESEEGGGCEDGKCEQNSPKPVPRRKKDRKPAPAPDDGDSEKTSASATRKPTPKPMPKPVEPNN